MGLGGLGPVSRMRAAACRSSAWAHKHMRTHTLIHALSARCEQVPQRHGTHAHIAHSLSPTKVAQLHVALLAQEDVACLDVALHGATTGRHGQLVMGGGGTGV